MYGLLVLSISLLVIATDASGGFDFDLSRRPTEFDFSERKPTGFSPTFLSETQSTKFDSRRSQTEETQNEVLTHSQSNQWTRGFQDNGQGGLQKLDSSSSEERTAGRSSKDLKASESGESLQRDKQLTQVNGKTVLNTDTGKQSSFNNSGHNAKNTEFSSETSSSDNRLVKVVLPPPPPPLAACFGRTRASLVFLVHASADADNLARVLSFLEAFLGRLMRARAVVVFFNSRVLDVVHYPVEGLQGGSSAEALQRRLAEVARSLRSELDDDCNLQAAAAAAERIRGELHIPTPCSLVLLAPGGFRVDERALASARAAADDARRSFDQLTVVVDHRLEPRAANLLGMFSSGQLDLPPPPPRFKKWPGL